MGTLFLLTEDGTHMKQNKYSFYFQFSTKRSFLTLSSISKALVLQNKNLGVKLLNYFPFNKPVPSYLSRNINNITLATETRPHKGIINLQKG